MKYLVMETHPAYAVLLDEEGRYLKAANLRYQVGDTVGDIVALREPAKRAVGLGRPLAGAAALAACLCLVFFGYYRPNFTAYGTLRIQINPDVEMTISRTERVLALEGLNEDGEALIAGYSHEGKSRDRATDELVDRAIEMGYLSGGDTITITVNSPDARWQVEEEQQVRRQLEDRYGEQVIIRLASPEGQPQEDEPEVVVPVVPPTPPSTRPSQPGAEGSHDDTDYGPGSDGLTNYDDTDYGPGADGVTDYGDTDYGPYQDGATDYEDKDDGGADAQGGDSDDDNNHDDGDDDDNDNDDDDDDDGH